MKKLLVANRGEIAIRIARASNDLGLKTIGIYSEDDHDSLHVSKMAESYQLKGEGAKAYLDSKDIISIALNNKVDLIHPGYGFLSENPNFAKQVEAAGLTFIGPQEKTLRLFGHKVRSKQLADENKVPTVKGTSGNISSYSRAAFLALS